MRTAKTQTAKAHRTASTGTEANELLLRSKGRTRYAQAKHTPVPLQLDKDKPSYAAALGRVVEALRESKGMDRSTLAKTVGISGATMSRIERGLVLPNTMVFENIAAALGTTDVAMRAAARKALNTVSSAVLTLAGAAGTGAAAALGGALLGWLGGSSPGLGSSVLTGGRERNRVFSLGAMGLVAFIGAAVAAALQESDSDDSAD